MLKEEKGFLREGPVYAEAQRDVAAGVVTAEAVGWGGRQGVTRGIKFTTGFKPS